MATQPRPGSSSASSIDSRAAMIRSGSRTTRRATRSAAPRISAPSAATRAASDQSACALRRPVDAASSGRCPRGRATSGAAERDSHARVAAAFPRRTEGASRVSSVAPDGLPTSAGSVRDGAGDAATPRVSARDGRAARDAGTVRCVRAGEGSTRDRDEAARWFDAAPTDAPLSAERPGSAGLAPAEVSRELSGAWATGAAGAGSGAGTGAGARVGAGVGAGCSATGGGGGVAGEGTVAGGAAGAGGGLEALRGGSKPSGSTYVSPSPTRMPRWT